MRRLIISCLVFVSVTFAQQYKLGSKVTGFAVQDLSGAPVSFGSLGAVTVVTFISTQCPVSNTYNDRMSAVYKTYSAKGVKFVFVNANRNESTNEVAEHAKSVGFPFTVYKDPNNELADRFDAQVTPESYVLDSAGMLVYRGQVDDNRNQARVHQQSLSIALDAVLAGKPVPVAETKAFGCSIKRARRT
jgi:thiol-disulfide isomerase/thioredoxin